MNGFKKQLFITGVFIVSAVLAAVFTWPSTRAYFIACDVGQGDAILLTKGNTQILIDGGPNNRVLECLADNMPFWDRKIELVINTHPEKDHLAGLLLVVDQYQVDQFIGNNYWQDTALFADFVQKTREKEIRVYSPQRGDNLRLDGFNFTVLWPEKPLGDMSIWQNEHSLVQAKQKARILGEKTVEPNEESIVLLLEYKEKKALLAGDISITTEKNILSLSRPGKIDLLKIGHHGSKYSSGEEWLEALSPALAVISVGKNPWGHPTGEVLSRLDGLNIKVLRTDEQKIKILLE